VTPRGFPIQLNLTGKKCLVVGSGPEAQRRAHALLESGAKVVVITHHQDAEPFELAHESLSVEVRAFCLQDLNDAWLVVQVALDGALAAELSRCCGEHRVFFCAVDQPEFSSYSHMALARSGALTLAISTEGQVPALGRRLRDELSRLLDAADAAREVERLSALRRTTPPELRREVLMRAVADVELTGELRFKK
jgi:siroheme synthase-like protein